jgi:serine/threonine protein kinase
VTQRNAPPASPSEAIDLEDDAGPTPVEGSPQVPAPTVDDDEDGEPITSIGQAPTFPFEAGSLGGHPQTPGKPSAYEAPSRPTQVDASAPSPPKPNPARGRGFGRVNTPTEMAIPAPGLAVGAPPSAYQPPHPPHPQRPLAPAPHPQPPPHGGHASHSPFPPASARYTSGPVPRDVAEDSGSGSRPAFVAPPQHPSHTPSAGRPLPAPPAPAQLAPPPAPSFRGATPAPLPVMPGPSGSMALRADVARGMRAASAHIIRSRSYAFVLDERGMPIELGSGRSAKAFLGEERWVESKTDFRRDVVIKILQKGVSEEDHMRFQMEKELLERVQGHPNIVRLFGSGEGEDPSFIPPQVRDKVMSDFVIIERMEMSLEERLKGPRERGKREDLLAYDMRERVFRVLDYMIPVASAVEFAHLVRNVCHRDLKPANVLLGLPDPNLRGSVLEVRLADFNIAKLHDEEFNVAMTRTNMNPVPGTLFFQSPEQETNVIELLVNVVQGSTEVEFFEDFYIQIEKNDTFALFNRSEHYAILRADRGKKKIILGRPYQEGNESNVRAKVQKSVGRPADIYSIGAMLYYLISGAYGNPKTIYDNFHKFIEYERADGSNTIEAYLQHEYAAIDALRSPKSERATEMAPADKFFSYKHYLDGNGELIDREVMRIIAKCMIRNKPDSYCQAHEVETRGISEVVKDLIDIYTLLGTHPSARAANLRRVERTKSGFFRRMWLRFTGIFRRK